MFWLSLTPHRPAVEVSTSFRSSEKHRKRVFLASATFPLLPPLVPTLPPPASPSAPDADLTDTTGTQIPPSMGCLHCMHSLAGGCPLTQRGFALEQDFVPGQGFTRVTSILRFAHCQIWKEESGPLMKFSPLFPLEPLTLLSQKAIAVSAFQEKQQCCAKSADWQQVGIGFLC